MNFTDTFDDANHILSTEWKMKENIDDKKITQASATATLKGLFLFIKLFIKVVLDPE